MPVIAMFYGVIVRRYVMDNRQHAQPHVHVEHAGNSAVIDIDDGSLLAGSLPLRQLRLVQAWIELRREELLADWSLAIQGSPLFEIEPLR